MLKEQKIALAKSLLLIERDACAVTGPRTSIRHAFAPSGKVIGSRSASAAKPYARSKTKKLAARLSRHKKSRPAAAKKLVRLRK